MKKLYLIIGWSLAGLLCLVGLAAGVVYFWSSARLNRRHVVAVTPALVSSDAGAVERGHHIATTRGCLKCHGEDLAGGKVVDNPMIGKIFGPNLTRGSGGLPVGFANEGWVRAIRHGVGHDGRPLVIMPSVEYSQLSETDFGALLAFLIAAPNVDRDSVPVRLGPVGRMLIATGKLPLAAEVIDHTKVRASEVAPGVTVEYGRYLAANCIGCHGSNLSGGKIHGAPPDWPPSSNLTPIADGPLAHWTEEDFIAALRSRRRPNGTELNTVMPSAFGHMTDDELRALWIFLRSLPPSATGSSS